MTALNNQTVFLLGQADDSSTYLPVLIDHLTGGLIVQSRRNSSAYPATQIHVTVAGLAVASSLTRQYLLIQNTGSNIVYVGLGIDVSIVGNQPKAIILGNGTSGAGGSYEAPAEYVYTGNVYLAGTGLSATVIYA